MLLCCHVAIPWPDATVGRLHRCWAVGTALCSLAMGFFLSALGMLGGLLSLSILGRGEGVGVPRRS